MTSSCHSLPDPIAVQPFAQPELVAKITTRDCDSLLTPTPNFDVEPGYVPPGYRLTTRLEGRGANAFGGAGDDQLLLSYKRSDAEVAVFPLVIYAARDSDGILFATEQRPGRPLSLGIKGVRAHYHDGMWAPGSGPDEQRIDDDITIHWSRGGVHSITGVAGRMAMAVRGPVTEATSFDELVAVARSLAWN